MPGTSTYWGPPMTDSQFAVFHFDVKSMTMRNGEPLVFDGLAAAEPHCREQIAADPATGCRIYNHAGIIAGTFSDERSYKKHHGRPAAKRSLTIGALCLAAGIGGIALDAWLGWRLTLGVLLGARFLWVGTVKFSEGIAGLTDGAR